MLSIGEFSKICLTTTKALRYYDEIGLIKPQHINKENNYRYYDISQLKIMLKINRFKAYGFSLEEISELLKENNADNLCKKLFKKQKSLSEKIEGFNKIIKSIDNDIKNLEEGIDIMDYLENLEVKLLEQKPINILFSRQIMNLEEFDFYFSKLYEKIAKEKLNITGNPMAIYYDKEFNPLKSDIELAIPVKENVKGTRELKSGLCAVLRLNGPYSELPSCYARLTEWMEKENYSLTAPPYEIYLTDIKSTKPENQKTDIFFPVKKK